MKLKEYLDSIDGSLSAQKRIILTALWESGKSWPRPWVASSDLLGLDGVGKYFDRRIRELRDDKGCDIESGRDKNGDHAYRLVSTKLKPANPRKYLTSNQKKKLIQDAGGQCVVCGSTIGLQADHKVPLSRGGTHGTSNWQVLCVGCNVAKRGSCHGCSDDCKECPWAFPESNGVQVGVRVPKTLAKRLADVAGQSPKAQEKFILAAIKKSLSR